MEVRLVLDRYLALLTARSWQEIEENFASNGVIDFYGKTIKGHRGILSFVRTNLYVHSFNSPKPCDQFETRETQTQTRTVPLENLIPEGSVHDGGSPSISPYDRCTVPSTSTSTVTSSSTPRSTTVSRGFETPPPLHRPEDAKLPELGRGRRFLSDSDDSDNEEKKASTKRKKYCSITEFARELNKNSELLLMSDEDLGEPSSKKRLHFDLNSTAEEDSSGNEEEEGDEKEGLSNAKKQKLTPGTKIPKQKLVNAYSDLKYLEVTGEVKIAKKIKHRQVGHGTSPVSSHFDQVSDPDDDQDLINLPPQTAASTPSTNLMARNTKLRISYREHKSEKNKIQFVLACYEHLARKPSTRRNLMSQFVQPEEQQKSRTKNSATKSERLTPQKERRKKLTPRKPLRF